MTGQSLLHVCQVSHICIYSPKTLAQCWKDRLTSTHNDRKKNWGPNQIGQRSLSSAQSCWMIWQAMGGEERVQSWSHATLVWRAWTEDVVINTMGLLTGPGMIFNSWLRQDYLLYIHKLHLTVCTCLGQGYWYLVDLDNELVTRYYNPKFYFYVVGLCMWYLIPLKGSIILTCQSSGWNNWQWMIRKYYVCL